MNKQAKRKQQNLKATVEISHSDLSMVIVETAGEKQSLRGHHATWLKEASSLADESAVEELTMALSSIVAAEKLAGTKVDVALSSDFCVTRVVAGETERVRAELRSLNERSNKYLLLGAGEKAVAESTRAIDAKQTQAWLTVTNHKTLEHLTQAFNQTGLQVRLIEHDMVAICRAVGHMQQDSEAPVIIAKINRRGVVLGVSYKGQLLFDYRPGGVDCKGRIAEIVQLHLERIQRYCNRQFRFAAGEIKTVLLCGPADEVEPVRQQFAGSDSELQASVLNPYDVSSSWQFDSSLGPGASFFAAVGSALVEDERLGAAASGRGMPNLMDYVLSANRAPLWPTLVRAAWPIAAALLLAVGIYGLACWKASSATALERQLAEFEAGNAQIEVLRRKTAVANKKLTCLQRINGELTNPAWNELLSWIGQSTPEGIGLDSLLIDQDGTVSITGPGASEDLIFQFVEYLERIPVLDQVALEGQRPIKVGGQRSAIQFDIKAKFNDQSNLIGRRASND